MRNYTEITEFILLGLSDDPQLQVVSFIFLLITYMLSITGNLTIITLTLLDAHLQTPMYFFLSNLSFVDLCYSSVIISKMLVNFLSEQVNFLSQLCPAVLFLLYFRRY